MKNGHFQYIADELNKFGKKFGAYYLLTGEKIFTNDNRNFHVVEALAEKTNNRRIIIIRKGDNL